MSDREENCTCDSPEDSAGLHHREWCGQPVAGPAVTTREEAAAKEIAGVEDWFPAWPEDFRDKYRVIAKRALTAADAHDLANNVHRVRLDDATVERAARALYKNEGGNWNTAPDGLKDDWRKSVRDTIAALTAAVEVKP
jgi:hypothetical protein